VGSTVASLLGVDEHPAFGRPGGGGPTAPRSRGRWAAVALVVLLVVVLGTVAVDDASIHGRLRRARAALAAATVTESQSAQHLTAERGDLALTSAEARALSWMATASAAETRSTASQLQSAQSGLALETLTMATLGQCLSGVQRTFAALAFGNTGGAVGTIDSVAGPCLALEGGGSGGPVYPFDLADPSVIAVGRQYYAYGTNAEAGAVQVLESSDLAHWTAVGNALPNLPSWASPGYTWAPSVLRLDPTSYVLFYTVQSATPLEQCISAARGSSPTGPFVDTSSAPLVCQSDLGGSIDPSPFIDGSGTIYLDWKSEGAAGQPPTIWAQPMNNRGTALTGSPSALLTPSQPWEGGVVEGPSMFSAGGQTFLFYSGNNWDTAAYAVGVATCRGPLGPCTKPLGQPILASGPTMAGPGSPSLFVDGPGQLVLAFHAWLPGAVGDPHSRLLFLRTVTFGFGLPVIGPAP